MAITLTTGAQNKAMFFRAKLNTAQTGYDIWKKSGTTDEAVTLPTATAASFTLEGIGSSKPSFQEDGTLKFSFEQIDNGADFWTFRNLVISPTATTTEGLEEYYLENGDKWGGASAAALEEPILLIWYGAGDKLTDPTNIQIFAVAGTITATTGTFDTKYNSINKPTFEFSGVKLPKAFALNSVEVGNIFNLFDTSVLAIPTGAKSIPANAGYFIEWMPTA